METIFKKIYNLFNLPLERQEKVKEQIKEESKGDLDFYVLSVFAAVIITLGLILDNGAVVIGGMLMTPLVWPMLALALGLVRGSIRILEPSLFTIVKVSLITIIVSLIIGWLSPFPELGQEVLSRTQPTILELMIAFVAGFVAAFVIGYPGLGSFIAGVVIAAAVVPPLCVVGLSLSQQNLSQASGAFLLFISNLIAVILAATLFFLSAKFKPVSTNAGLKRRTNNLIWLVVFMIIVSIPLLVITSNILSQNRQYNLTKETLVANLKEGKITELEVKGREGVIFVNATLRASRNLTSWEMNSLADYLSQALQRSVNLQIMVTPTMQGGKIIESTEDISTPTNNNLNQLKDQVFPKTK